MQEKEEERGEKGRERERGRSFNVKFEGFFFGALNITAGLFRTVFVISVRATLGQVCVCLETKAQTLLCVLYYAAVSWQ